MGIQIAVILLHRPAFFDSETPKVDLSTSPQMTGFVLGSGSPPTSQQKCAAAAKEVLHIAQIYDEAYGLQRSCQTVSVQFWLTGTIFLLLAAQQGQMQNTATVSGSARRDPTLASRQLLAVVEYLKKAGRVWGECFKSADVLTKLHEGQSSGAYHQGKAQLTIVLCRHTKERASRCRRALISSAV